MDGLNILPLYEKAPPEDHNLWLELLTQTSGIQVMRQYAKRDSIIWISPAQDAAMVEFFLVLYGRIILSLPEGEKELGPGECFFSRLLSQDVPVRALEDVCLLYVTDQPMYGELEETNAGLLALLNEINEKDGLTCAHSRRVMHLAVHLNQLVKRDKRLTMDELVNASLFHDVGKCRVPDEILKKKGRLTEEEFDVMRKHPVYSAEILLPDYGERVSNFARWHHERLDGSGYPDGLKGDQIPYAARLIAVADAYEAMTGPRCYRAMRTREDALEELKRMGGQFDAEIVAALEYLTSTQQI